MKLYVFVRVLALCVALTVSVYAPLWAIEDSTLTVPKTTERPFWMWQILNTSRPTGFDADFNARLGIQPNSDLPTTGLSINISPFHIAWSHNRWIVSGSFNILAVPGLIRFSAISGSGITAIRRGFEYDFSVGYALINSPRFRLYPLLSSVAITDRVTITRQTSFTALLQSNASNSFSMERDAGGFGIAVGADYRFPLEYGDLYIVAKAGYTLSVLGAWTSEGVLLPDANINWFSGRGVFFQLGIGFGSERQ